MRRIYGAGAATAAATVAMLMGGAMMTGANGQENANHGQGKACSNASLRGDYGIQIQGTRPAAGGLTESVVGIGFRTYDGQGGFTQITNVKGTINGYVPDSQGAGTYEVNPDCTGIIHVSAGPWHAARGTAGDRRQRP